MLQNTMRKINMLQILRTKSAHNKFYEQEKISTQSSWTSSVSRGEKLNVKVSRSQKSTTNKNWQAASSKSKNQHAASSMNKVSFTRRKINLQVSRREISTCNKFLAENQHTICSNKNAGHFHSINLFLRGKKLEKPLGITKYARRVSSCSGRLCHADIQMLGVIRRNAIVFLI